jgi:hypothetical protein
MPDLQLHRFAVWSQSDALRRPSSKNKKEQEEGTLLCIVDTHTLIEPARGHIGIVREKRQLEFRMSLDVCAQQIMMSHLLTKVSVKHRTDRDVRSAFIGSA